MSNNRETKKEVGFLPHEVFFVASAVKRAEEAMRVVNKDLGEAVGSSGGDWVFDDPASQAVVQEAYVKKANLEKLNDLFDEFLRRGEISYPTSEDEVATYGSRIKVDEGDEVVSYDLATHFIPGLPSEDDVYTVTPDAPIANSLHGSSVGESINWKAANDREFSGIVVEVDQFAVEAYYKHLLKGRE